VGTKPTGGFAIYKKYIVRLTEEERSQIERLLRSGRAHAQAALRSHPTQGRC
jgi:hypothetical protein